MKKIFTLAALAIVCLQLTAQVNFTALKFSPEFPKANDKLTITYNATYSSLIHKKKMEAAVYLFNTVNWKVAEPTLIKSGDIYSAAVTLDSNTSAVAVVFIGDDEKDLNNGKGYIIPVYNANNNPVKDYYLTASNLNDGLGENLLGAKTSNDAALQSLEDGKMQYPELADDPKFLSLYWYRLGKVKKKDADPFILAGMQNLLAKLNPTENDYSLAAQYYLRMKMKAQADSVTAIMKSTYPNGAWKKNEAGMSFSREKDPAKKLALYQEYIAKFPPTKENQELINNFKSQLAGAYAGAKNYTAYNEWSNGLDKGTVAYNNNNYAWKMAEADDNIQEAKRMAYDATSYAKNEMLKPAEKKPDDITAKQWEEQRKSTYAMYGDTYAYILYKLGDYKEGYAYAKDAATINKLKDAELNERYAMLAAKTLPLAEAKKLIEQFAKDGTATPKTKDALKELYVKQKKNDTGFETYLAALEAESKIKRRSEIAGKMMNDPAPKFSLKDFEGNLISLDDLKGKTVVVDFWATWCGPCIASMPGMNKALAKYKDNADVKFLFIDTWETTENKLDNAKDFMIKKNYPFHVLLDTEDKMVGDFAVSGIPTKFIIDKTGKIRFKTVGFNGNDDDLVDEVSTMIELAGK